MNETALFQHIISTVKSEIRTHIPAEVESFDPNKLTVNVKILIKGIKIGSSRKVKLETGEVVLVDDYTMPSVVNVPVSILSFSNGRITFPIKKGLQGTLAVCDRDIRFFKKDQKESVQGSLRKFNLSDAIFYPGLAKRAELTDYNNEAIELRYDEKLIQINGVGINIVGDVNITGNLIVSEQATVNNLVATTEANIGGIDFTTHTHLYTPGTGTPTQTNPPV